MTNNSSNEQIGRFLLNSVNLLTQNGLPETALLFQDLGEKIKLGDSDKSELSQLAIKCVHSLSNEWDKEPYRAKLKKSMSEGFKLRISPDTPSDNNVASSYNSLVDSMIVRKNTITVMNDLGLLIFKTSDEHEKFLLGCFFYLVALEGDFDQSLTIIYLVLKRQRDEPITLANPRAMNVKKLKCEFEQLAGKEVFDMFFEGHNSHLRNSIAHANFQFDYKTRVITFEDFSPDTGERTWGPVSMSAHQFIRDYVDKIQSVSLFASVLAIQMILIFQFVQPSDLQPKSDIENLKGFST